MSDSMAIIFPIVNMPEEDFERLNFPYNTLMPLDNNGEVKSPFSCWMTTRSPITNEGYRIRGILSNKSGQRPVLDAYEVELNPPACIIGNNLLLVNNVYKGGIAALYLLQYWLAEQGCSIKELNAISTDTAVIKSVTLTYLADCSSNEEAHAERNNMYSHGDALHNKKSRKVPLKKSQVYKVGGDENATVYMNHHDYKISCYVKDVIVGGASSNFASAEVEDTLRKEAEKYLRIELKANERWLTSHDRQSIKSWRHLKGRPSPYCIGMETIRAYLRLDDDLRIRSPKPEHLEKLSEYEGKLLRGHLKGRSARNHVSLKGSNSRKFYPVRKRLLKKIRIDLNIPWEVQRSKLRPSLDALLSTQVRYRPTEDLADHVYCLRSINAALRRLEELIAMQLRRWSK